MALESLDRGDKFELHLKLYEREVAILDAHCARYNCSRAAVIGRLLIDSADIPLGEIATSPTRPGARGRRSPPRT